MFGRSKAAQKKTDLGNTGSKTEVAKTVIKTHTGTTQISSITISQTIQESRRESYTSKTHHTSNSQINSNLNTGLSDSYTSILNRSPLRNRSTSLFYSFPETDVKPFQTPSRPSLPTYQSVRNETLAPPLLKHSVSTGTGFDRSAPVYKSFGASTQSLPSTTATKNSSVIPTYNTNGKKRGKVLLINNINFKDSKERTGAKKDGDDLKVLFKKMGFTVDSSTNLKASEMEKKIKQFRKDSSLKEYDMSFVIMMSHGNNFNKSVGSSVRGGYTQIFGTDDKGLAVDDVLEEFSGTNCKYLMGKPKIFIFQCCRGKDDEIETDASPIKNVIKDHADMLIAFSTLPGFSSNRDPVEGTWYIQSICEVFKAHSKDFTVEELLKIVDDKLGKKHPKYKQTSTYECRGFKQCYLNPNF